MEVRKAQLGTICFIVPWSLAILEAAGEQGWTSPPIRGTPVAAGAEGRDDMSVEALRTDSELSCWSCCRRLSSEQLSADFSNKKKPGFRGRKICYLCVCVCVCVGTFAPVSGQWQLVCWEDGWRDELRARDKDAKVWWETLLSVFIMSLSIYECSR